MRKPGPSRCVGRGPALTPALATGLSGHHPGPWAAQIRPRMCAGSRPGHGGMRPAAAAGGATAGLEVGGGYRSSPGPLQAVQKRRHSPAQRGPQMAGCSSGEAEPLPRGPTGHRLEGPGALPRGAAFRVAAPEAGVLSTGEHMIHRPSLAGGWGWVRVTLPPGLTMEPQDLSCPEGGAHPHFHWDSLCDL